MANRTVTGLLTGCCVAAAAAGLAGCGSGGTVSTSSASDPSGPATASISAGLRTARRALASYEATPKISVPALPSRPPTGETIDFIGCPVSSCLEIQTGVQAAARALGWHVKVIQAQVTPESGAAAMTEAAQNPGDGVIDLSLLPTSAMSTQIEAIKRANVPLVTIASPSGRTPGVTAAFQPPSEIAQSGRVMADWIIADSGGKANAVFFGDPAYPFWSPAQSAFLSTMHSLCPGCKTATQPINFTTGIGTTIPGAIVNYLQRNPSVDYAGVIAGDAMAGVPEALAAAGLERVKIVTRIADTINFKDIAEGKEAAAVTEETIETGWRSVDAIARVLTHGQLSPCCQDPVGTLHVVTRDDLPVDTSKPYVVPDYQAPFLRAWHVG
jgi:ABC-type sugar transport system substrate-binding protein